LLPHLEGVVLGEARHSSGGVRLAARVGADTAGCTRCGQAAARVHSRYRRHLADAPIGGRPVQIVLWVRRFFCDNAGCPARTFAEQVPGLTSPRALRTGPLRTVLEAIGLALAGRAGARLADKLGIVVSRDTLVRLVRALPDPPIAAPQALGVDDFALRRGHVYGTVVIDLATHRPLDLLGDRTSDTLAAWLREHPGAQVVSRDRAGAYAAGIRVGAPDAVQVADRWHLWHNLVEAVEKVVRQHHGDLRDPTPAPPIGNGTGRTRGDAAADGDTDDGAGADGAGDDGASDDGASDDGASDDGAGDDGAGDDGVPGSTGETRLAARTRERHAAIHALLASGTSVSAISQALRLDRKTVRRFVRAGSVAELLTAHPTLGSVLDGYVDHLQQRWSAGVTDAVALTAEITALGYRGSVKTVRRYLQPLRSGHTAIPRPPAPPTVREMTGLLTRHPDSLTDDERTTRDAVLNRSPALRATHDRVGEFATILTQRRGHELNRWLQQVGTDGAPALRSFAAGLERDHDAVTAGLTLSYSSGPVEGTIHRIKMIKRQMFGRANLDLLRKRVLLAT
jgi:transposase